MTDTSISDNTKKSLAFLKTLFGNKRINIVAIDPKTQGVVGITRSISHPADASMEPSTRWVNPEIAQFIDNHNGKRNLYYSVNTPTDDAPDGKLKKEHIKEINAVWLDADPKKDKDFQTERDRLLRFAKDLMRSDHPPTVVTDSGGGIQAFWMLDAPVPVTDAARREYEALSRGLADKYDTDRVQNIDRIMRLPYTFNIPTKQKAGREVVLAKSTKIDTHRYSSLDFITPSYADHTDDDIDYGQLKLSEIKKPLEGDLLTKFEKLRRRNEKVDDLWTLNNDTKEGDRSDRDFTLAKELKLEGFTIHEAAVILWNYPHGKVQSVNNPVREITRCYERSGIDFTDTLDAETIERIAKQVNPLTAAKQERQQQREQRKKTRRGLIHASKASHKTSGIPIIKNFFDQKSTVLLFGPPNSGKSFVTLDMAMAIASGQKKWGHFKIKQQMGVVVVCGEAGQSYGKRVEATKARFGFDENTSWSELPFGYLDNYYDLSNDKDHLQEIREEIKNLEQLSGHKCGLLIIDTLSATFGAGNENASDDARKYLNNLKQIGHDLKVTVLIVHHTGKDETSGARGSSVFLGDVDTQLRVTAAKKGDKYERTVLSTKQRDTDKDKVTKFGLKVIELAKDEDGDPVDTCIVTLETDDGFEDFAVDTEEHLSYNARCALKAIRLHDSSERPLAHPSSTGIASSLRPDRRLTEKQIKTILFNDFMTGIGMFADGCLDALKAMAEPSKSDQTTFERACKELRKSGYTVTEKTYRLIENDGSDE